VAEIPVTAGLMLDPAPADAPQVDASPRRIGMQLTTDIRRAHAAKIHAPTPQQAFTIVLAQPKMLFQAPVDAWIGTVINRHAVGHLTAERPAHPLFRRHRDHVCSPLCEYRRTQDVSIFLSFL